MKILVIGKNGQLGQHLIKYFQDNFPDFTLIGTVRHKSYDKQPVIYDELRVIEEVLDLTDQVSIDTVVQNHRPDFIFNTGANAFVGDSWKLAEQHAQISGLGTLRLLESIRKYVPESVGIFLGSSEEMGCTQEDAPNGAQDEKTRLVPKSPYACAKLFARTLVDVYRNSYNLKVIQPWCFNFESKLRHEKYVTRKITKGVARIYHAIQNRKPFEPIKLGNINSSRSWQHAMDVADALWKCANQAGPAREWKPYAISANETHTVKQFIEKAFAAAGFKECMWVGEGLEERYTIPDYVSEFGELLSFDLVVISKEFFRPHDVDYLFGSSAKIREELGWAQKYTLDDIIKEMVEHDIQELT